MSEFLANEQISLRPVEPSDLDRMCQWENDSTLWQCGATIAPFSRKLMADYIASYTADIFVDRQLRMMIVDRKTETAVGMLDLYDFDPMNRRAGVGVMVASPYQRRGFGLAAIELAWTYCRRHLGMHQLWVVVACDNDGSLALFRRAGFKSCGSLRSWLRRGDSFVDALILQRLQ